MTSRTRDIFLGIAVLFTLALSLAVLTSCSRKPVIEIRSKTCPDGYHFLYAVWPKGTTFCGLDSTTKDLHGVNPNLNQNSKP